MLHELSDIVSEHLEEITDAKIRSYRLTRYFLVYVVRMVLELSEEGRRLISEPGAYLEDEEKWALVDDFLSDVVADIVVDFDAEIESEDETFDYKSELKSETGVTKLARRIVNVYRKELRKGRAKDLAAYLEDSDEVPA